MTSPIPPVEDRQIRTCQVCVSFWEAECWHDGIGCKLDRPEFNIRGSNFVFVNDEVEIAEYAKRNPCIYNLTKEEYSLICEALNFRDEK